MLLAALLLPVVVDAFEPVTQIAIAHTVLAHTVRLMELHGVGVWSAGGSSRVRYGERGVVRCPRQAVPGCRIRSGLRLAKRHAGAWLRHSPQTVGTALATWAVLENERGAMWALVAQDVAQDLLDAMAKHTGG